MDELLLPILVAAAVATARVGARRRRRRRMLDGREAQAPAAPHRRRRERRRVAPAARRRRVDHVQLEVDRRPRVPRRPRRSSRRCNRRLVQAYPDTYARRSSSAMRRDLRRGLRRRRRCWSRRRSLVGHGRGGVGAYLPFLLADHQAPTRGSGRSRLQLPEALDFLTRILQAGHSLSTGLQMMGEELPAAARRRVPPAATTSTASASRSRTRCKDMATRIESHRLRVLRHRGADPAADRRRPVGSAEEHQRHDPRPRAPRSST